METLAAFGLGYQMYGVQCDGVVCLDVADRLERLLKENVEKDAIIAKLRASTRA